MINLGIRNKDMYPSSEIEKKDYEKEIRYPELHVSGKLAEKMGAADLKQGDVVEVPIVIRIKSHSKNVSDGKTDYSMTICVEKMGDMVEVEKDVDDDLENEELPTTSAIAALSQPRPGWEE